MGLASPDDAPDACAPAAGLSRSLAALRTARLDAEVVAAQWIAFGPVLSERTGWLERIGRIQRGCRREQLVVIRADKP